MSARPMGSSVLTNATVFTGNSVHANSSVVIKDRMVAELVIGARARGVGATQIDLQGRRLVPGFIDIQVNGGGGVLFNDSHHGRCATLYRRGPFAVRDDRVPAHADQRR